jgi:hypothetical protein
LFILCSMCGFQLREPSDLNLVKWKEINHNKNYYAPFLYPDSTIFFYACNGFCRT